MDQAQVPVVQPTCDRNRTAHGCLCQQAAHESPGIPHIDGRRLPPHEDGSTTRPTNSVGSNLHVRLVRTGGRLGESAGLGIDVVDDGIGQPAGCMVDPQNVLIGVPEHSGW
jgi:hypothetical protein